MIYISMTLMLESERRWDSVRESSMAWSQLKHGVHERRTAIRAQGVACMSTVLLLKS